MEEWEATAMSAMNSTSVFAALAMLTTIAVIPLLFAFMILSRYTKNIDPGMDQRPAEEEMRVISGDGITRDEEQ
jgi:hypothetical protein